MLAIAALAVAAPIGSANRLGGGAEKVYAPKDCTRPQVKPNRIVLACGDFGIFVNHFDWNRWGGRKAKATGVLHAKVCDPDCATGPIRDYKVKVRLKRIRTRNCGRQTGAHVSPDDLALSERQAELRESDQEL